MKDGVGERPRCQLLTMRQYRERVLVKTYQVGVKNVQAFRSHIHLGAVVCPSFMVLTNCSEKSLHKEMRINQELK